MVAVILIAQRGRGNYCSGSFNAISEDFLRSQRLRLRKSPDGVGWTVDVHLKILIFEFLRFLAHHLRINYKFGLIRDYM